MGLAAPVPLVGARGDGVRAAVETVAGLIRLRALAGCGLVALAAGCGGGDAGAIRAILASDREAHYALDAARLTSNIADTLVSVSGGGVFRQSREDVEAFFRDYFRGAVYRAWDDLDPPIVRVAPGGRMAWAIRRVRVVREQPGLGGDTLRREFVSAWTATYEMRGGRWKMTTVTSTFVPEATRADRILEAALRRVGGPAPAAVMAHARAAGPDSRFEVTVHSARDGRARIDFDGGMSAAIGRDARWMRTPADPGAPLSPAMETFLRGHELHMNLLAPMTRYGPLHLSGSSRFAGVPAWALTGFDVLDEPVTFYYARSDTTPLGYQVADHAGGRGPVTVEYGAWRAVGGLRLPHQATFRQGPEVFTYAFEDIAIGPAPADSAFARPAL